MKKNGRILAIVAAVSVGALALAGVALAATSAPNADATQVPAATAACGACASLADNPEALKKWQALRIEKQEAWRAWFEKYGSDWRSDEAQSALQQLREKHWNDMRSLLETYNIDVPEGAGPGSCAGQGPGSRAGQGRGMLGGGGGCGGQGGGAMMGGARL